MSNRPGVSQAELAHKLQFLQKRVRYKILYGGRGSGKSWTVARALLLRAAAAPLRILCAREFQTSIDQSVRKLLAMQIEELQLSDIFTIHQDSITCTLTGAEFIFEGLRFNVAKIKSMEGIDICWVEEAQSVPEESWAILTPTIRKAGSEIWITFNPDMAHDATYQRFIVHRPRNARVLKLNYPDNPWFPKVLESEMEALMARDHAAYRHIWLGECRAQIANPLWTADMLAAARESAWDGEEDRRALIDAQQRIVIGVDPSGCRGPEDRRSDEIGIIVAGLGHDGVARVLEDRSGRYSPEGWARECAAAWRFWQADRVIAERNFGGALVAATLRAADSHVPVKEVDASRGKAARAEPVAALYEQGRVRHVGYFPELERQLRLFSTGGYKGPHSPDRADAAVWALTELMLGDDTTGMLEFYREERDQQRPEK